MNPLEKGLGQGWIPGTEEFLRADYSTYPQKKQLFIAFHGGDNGNLATSGRFGVFRVGSPSVLNAKRLGPFARLCDQQQLEVNR